MCLYPFSMLPDAKNEYFGVLIVVFVQGPCDAGHALDFGHVQGPCDA